MYYIDCFSFTMFFICIESDIFFPITGSDDESGLTKAIDDVFPNVQRLLCTKHIKENIPNHLKNKNGVTDKGQAEI